MYDLITINGTSIPDVKKGTVSISPNPKYNEYEGEAGNKIIDIISDDRIKGTVSYSGLLQSELQTIYGAITLVSTLEIYNPFTGNVKRFSALILVSASDKLIHDANANAWTFEFEFEEIDDAED